MDQSEPMTYQDAARYLGISYGALRAAISRGEITPFRPFRSKLKMLRRADLERYKQGERITPRAEARPPEPQAQALPVSPELARVWPLLLAISATIGERFATIASTVAGEYRGALVAMFQAMAPQQDALEQWALQIAREAQPLGEQAAREGMTENTLTGLTGILQNMMQKNGSFTEHDKWALEQLEKTGREYAQRAGAYTVPGEPAREHEKVSSAA